MASLLTSTSNRQLKVMIVDDNEKVRKLIVRVLQNECDSVVECSDGADALEAYKLHQPDLVLMDIQMPRVDGLTATKLLYQHDPHARIHILTDLDEDVLGPAASAAGACGYTSKEHLHELDSILARYRIGSEQDDPDSRT